MFPHFHSNSYLQVSSNINSAISCELWKKICSMACRCLNHGFVLTRPEFLHLWKPYVQHPPRFGLNSNLGSLTPRTKVCVTGVIVDFPEVTFLMRILRWPFWNPNLYPMTKTIAGYKMMTQMKIIKYPIRSCVEWPKIVSLVEITLAATWHCTSISVIVTGDILQLPLRIRAAINDIIWVKT